VSSPPDSCLLTSVSCPCAILFARMNDQPVCKSSDHIFVPILEVTIPLLRCIHCNVFAYHETVKQLAKNRAYRVDDDEPVIVPVMLDRRRVLPALTRSLGVSSSYWRRLLSGLIRSLGVNSS
jgi:hypothetical protein